MTRMRLRWALAAISSSVFVVVSACASPADDATPTTAGPASATAAVPTVLVLDASGSMTEVDETGSRMAAAKSAAGALIDAIPSGAEFALVAYGANTGASPAEKGAGCRDVRTLIPLGPVDADAARAAVASITPSGYTPIAAALRSAAAALPDTGPQAIVLVSDGADSCDSPPCEVAAELRSQRPDLTISTVGFRTGGAGDDDLACIAAATDGLFVTADSPEQLASRLRATRDLDTSRSQLTGIGIRGIRLGQDAGQIRVDYPDLPAVGSAGEAVIVWRDCDLTFTDGVLTAIRQHDGGRTIDGIGVGSTVGEATGIYGEPVGVEPGTGDGETLLYVGDRSAGTAFQMTADGAADDAAIRAVTLCLCLPGTGGGGSGGAGGQAAAPELWDDLAEFNSAPGAETPMAGLWGQRTPSGHAFDYASYIRIDDDGVVHAANITMGAQGHMEANSRMAGTIVGNKVTVAAADGPWVLDANTWTGVDNPVLVGNTFTVAVEETAQGRRLRVKGFTLPQEGSVYCPVADLEAAISGQDCVS